MKYSFTIKIKLKDTLNDIQRENILNYIETMSKRYDVRKIDDENYVRLNTDNTDLGKAAGFALKIAERDRELSLVQIDDLIDNCSSRYL